MKKTLILLLIAVTFYLAIGLYLLDKKPFLCPIEYKRDIVVRCDSRGNGFFAAERRGNRMHNGIDLLAEVGTPVLAARSGLVVAAKKSRAGMGTFVILRHTGGLTTIYGHLYAVNVAKNDFVRQGEIIGWVGKTGNANHSAIQPHLHFEVRAHGLPEDPLEYLQ